MKKSTLSAQSLRSFKEINENIALRKESGDKSVSILLDAKSKMCGGRDPYKRF